MNFQPRHYYNLRRIENEWFKSLILSAVSLHDAVIGRWIQATRYGRVDFADICCTSDSLLGGAVTSLGGRVVQYSHWDGSDLTTKAGTDKLKEDLLEKKPRVVWMTPPCTTQRTQQSVTRSRFHRIQMNILLVFLWLVKQESCAATLEQMWGSASLVAVVSSSWKNNVEVAEHLDVNGVTSLMEHFLRNLGTSSTHTDVGQICCVVDDVSMTIFIKHWRKKRRSKHRN